MDAIEILQADHRRVEGLFEQIQDTEEPDARKALLDTLVGELSGHSALEEQFVYPLLKEIAPTGEAMIDASLSEHQSVKELLLRLDKMAGDDQDLVATLQTLEGEVREHVMEEEQDALPQLRQHLDQDSLDELGVELERARDSVPTRPHPMAPNEPPGLTVAAPVAAMLDRLRDRLQGRTRV